MYSDEPIQPQQQQPQQPQQQQQQPQQQQPQQQPQQQQRQQQRLYKPRLFEILDGRPYISPLSMTYDEFSQNIREYLVKNNHIVSGQPRYLHIKLNHPSMFELTGLYGDRTYPLVDNWSQLRTWDDFLHFLQRRWVI